MILLLLSTVHAAEPTWELHLQGASGHLDGVQPYNLGLGVAGGLHIKPRLSAQLLAQGGFNQPRLDLRPELLLNLSAPDSDWGRLFLSAGYGVSFVGGVAPHGAVGLGLDLLDVHPTLGLRIQTRTLVGGATPEAWQLSVGLFRKRPSALYPEPPELPEPPAEEPTETEPDTPEPVALGMGPEWIPYPQCEWVPADQAEAARQALGEAFAGGPAPGSGAVVVLDPTSPSQGSVVVVSRPGDTVEVKGETLPVGPEGLLVLAAPPGRLDLEIRGAGQSLPFVVGVTADHVVWLRGDTMPLPEPLRVHYPGGSRTMSAEERAALEDFVTRLGDWNVTVQGFYSPEGRRDANLALADSRAQAARQALIDAGVPADHITILPPPEAPPTELSTTDQRAALISPVIPGDAE